MSAYDFKTRVGEAEKLVAEHPEARSLLDLINDVLAELVEAEDRVSSLEELDIVTDPWILDEDN